MFGNPKIHQSDECYTTRKSVELILDKYCTYDFTDKIVYCPCDGEQSQFVQVLKERKELYKYKELIYTSDDFRTHSDIFAKADIVITNPPFSLFTEMLIKYTKRLSKDFIIIGPMTGGVYGILYNMNIQYFEKEDRGVLYIFDRPDGTQFGVPVLLFCSNGIQMNVVTEVNYVKTDEYDTTTGLRKFNPATLPPDYMEPFVGGIAFNYWWNKAGLKYVNERHNIFQRTTKTTKSLF